MRNLSALPRLLIALLLIGAAPAASHAEAPALATLLPADVTMVLLVDDLPELSRTWPQTPLGKTWNDESVKRFLAPLRQGIELDRLDEMAREATGYPFTEIVDAFGGQVALVALPPEGASLSMEVEPSVAFVAEIADDKEEMVRKLIDKGLTKVEEDAAEGTEVRRIEEEFQGEILHIQQSLTEDDTDDLGCWALLDRYVLFTEARPPCRRLVSALKRREAGARLADSAAFLKLNQRSPGWDAVLYLNLKSLLPVFEQGMAEGLTDNEPAQNLQITAKAVSQALALDGFEGVCLSFQADDEMTALDMNLFADTDRGLLKLMAYKPGPVEPPRFVPRDAVAVGVAGFSIPDMWLAMKELFEQMSPMMGGFLSMGLQSVEAATGVELEKSVTNSLGDRIISVSFLSDADRPGNDKAVGRAESVYAFEVTDKQTLELALGAVVTMAGQGMELFDEQEYLGQTIHVSKQVTPPGEDTAGGEEPTQFAYALTDGFLLLGDNVDAIKSLLGGMRSPERSIWKNREVKAALRDVPEEASSFGYYNAGAVIETAFDALVKVQAAAAAEPAEGGDGDGGGEDEPFACCDLDAMPDIDTVRGYFGPGIDYLVKSKDGLYYTLRLLPPKQ